MTADPAQLSCPVSHTETERVLLGHGSGGQLSASLVRDVIVPALGSAASAGPLEDAAVVGVSAGELVVSTDSFVVSPLFFPGGDIGRLAVHGTVNDVAMMGGEPIALALAFIVEEGLPIETLRRVAASVGEAAGDAGVRVVTGDVKVVDHGAADGLFVTTTGVGRRIDGARLSAAFAQPGDAIVLSGPIGAHGVTIMNARQSLGFDSEVASDTRPLPGLVRRILAAGGKEVHTLRDPTRGGVASALNEIAVASGVGVEIDEPVLPISEPVAAACEMLGLDPLHVANEGCLVAFVAADAVDNVLATMRECPEGAEAVRIGTVVDEHPGRVTAQTIIGARRVVDMLIGEQLPRIC